MYKNVFKYVFTHQKAAQSHCVTFKKFYVLSIYKPTNEISFGGLKSFKKSPKKVDFSLLRILYQNGIQTTKNGIQTKKGIFHF